ncbi:MAG: hypothetical protein ACD_24C00485G0010 [uncultured bacterium]|nr:MAG: hypothetical protein ACD_24C00485G0010 [uncultured bacterium]
MNKIILIIFALLIVLPTIYYFIIYKPTKENGGRV